MELKVFGEWGLYRISKMKCVDGVVMEIVICEIII